MQKYIPTTFHDPFGLFLRLIRSGDSTALFTLGTALLGVIASPLDLLLQPLESRQYRKASSANLPLIFVCGAPRTGTTLASQVLIRHLPVTYFNNLTAMFPRSPIVINQLFGRFLTSAQHIDFKSYYGKTNGFAGPNDALYIWDRWFGTDRSIIPTEIDEPMVQRMTQFFGAVEEAWGRPLINKNNSLNTFAHLVAEVFENAYFVCMTRDPVYHAQALYRARNDIHGDPSLAYGIHLPDDNRDDSNKDPLEDVCDQVIFHAQMVRDQFARIGPERFLVVSYENFCQDPASIVEKIGQVLPVGTHDAQRLRAELKPFRSTNHIRIDTEKFEKMQAYLKGHGELASALSLQI
ncbi:MAG: sulfotransferase [Chloroflexota bacterium]